MNWFRAMKIEVGVLITVAALAVLVAGCTTTKTVTPNNKAYAMRQRHVSLDSATTSGPAVGLGGGAGGGAHGSWISAETAGSLLEAREIVNEENRYGPTDSSDLMARTSELPEDLETTTVDSSLDDLLNPDPNAEAGPNVHAFGGTDVDSPELTAARSALKTVHFDYDRAEIRDDQMETIKENARYLHEHPNIAVNLEGHCDERGTEEYNMALSEKRAEAVREAMVSLGIQTHRLSSVPYGEAAPLDPGHTEEAYAQNRRVEFAPTSVQYVSMGVASN